jgi:hypothetical protein
MFPSQVGKDFNLPAPLFLAHPMKKKEFWIRKKSINKGKQWNKEKVTGQAL